EQRLLNKRRGGKDHGEQRAGKEKSGAETRGGASNTAGATGGSSSSSQVTSEGGASSYSLWRWAMYGDVSSVGWCRFWILWTSLHIIASFFSFINEVQYGSKHDLGLGMDAASTSRSSGGSTAGVDEGAGMS
ncbi:unnamed protein product, partial [Amoebophrya sp. A25]